MHISTACHSVGFSVFTELWRHPHCPGPEPLDHPKRPDTKPPAMRTCSVSRWICALRPCHVSVVVFSPVNAGGAEGWWFSCSCCLSTAGRFSLLPRRLIFSQQLSSGRAMHGTRGRIQDTGQGCERPRGSRCRGVQSVPQL